MFVVCLCVTVRGPQALLEVRQQEMLEEVLRSGRRTPHPGRQAPPPRGPGSRARPVGPGRALVPGQRERFGGRGARGLLEP